ncbi:acetyl-coenzyme A carboxylase carboxyl transferase subunit alpha [Pelistega indica]|uniref:Acetyl-coenzyme A carboxylase carboxyl transferase subunit alpha n=1 Tax=Pelistega indica TaxID=1414851 RepID=V8FXD6_9BURK|nr:MULTISPECIES: DUF3460 family protein [Pelistega]ETD68939.1 acetyl-coenzyme A carboxylase carboxyl transferase subunit alpha [Pelistega indica]
MSKSYESEATLFLKQYKKDHPETMEKQLAGRARLWDKVVDTEQQEQYKAARVYQQPYVYLTK